MSEHLTETIFHVQENEEPMVLENLSEQEEKEKRYIPPKKKQTLSPAARKIVEENKTDISNIEGSGKDG